MQKDPYLILGLTNEATKEELDKAYKDLRNKYAMLRFEEGEVGANASKMLDEIEIAYRDCLEDLKNKEVINNYGTTYGQIEELIKEMKLEKAQEELDKNNVRDAEWHYYQAQIFYKRQWNMEAKQQLEIACDLDPANPKYKTTLERLEKVINRPKDSFNQQSENNQQRAGYTRPNYSQPQDNSGACCNACSTLICADCCCECCGGDLIPCC